MSDQRAVRRSEQLDESPPIILSEEGRSEGKRATGSSFRGNVMKGQRISAFIDSSCFFFNGRSDVNIRYKIVDMTSPPKATKEAK